MSRQEIALKGSKINIPNCTNIQNVLNINKVNIHKIWREQCEQNINGKISHNMTKYNIQFFQNIGYHR